MNSSLKVIELIEWDSCTEMMMDKTYDGDFVNNPFDVLEIKAANMSPMDYGVDRTSFEDHSPDDPPCCNFFSPLWIREVRQDISEVIKEHMPLCNDEEEKEQLRKETRQKIKMLIEREILKHKKKCLDKSFAYCTPPRNAKSCSSIVLGESLLNTGFLIKHSRNTSNSSDLSKTFNRTFVVSHHNNSNYNNTSNSSVGFHFEELNSFDLDALEPEWLESFNFSSVSVNASIDVQNEVNMSLAELEQAINQSDLILKTLNHNIDNDESSVQNENTSILMSSPTKTFANNNILNADISLQHTIQSDDENELEQLFSGQSESVNQVMPVACSTPSSNSVIKKVMSLNVTKCLENPLTNNSECKYGNTVILNSKRRSCLPLLKQSKMPFRGKENVKPE